MNQPLDNLRLTPGVIGCALFLEDGALIGAQLQPPYEPDLLVQAHQATLRLADTWRTNLNDGDMRALLARYTFGYVLIRLFYDRTLIVLAAADANLALINVALNVASMKVANQQLNGPYAAAAATGPHHAFPSGSFPASTSNTGSTSTTGSFPASPSGSGPFPASSSSQTRARTAAVDCVDRETMQHLLKVAIRHFGTDAQTILTAELRAMGVTPKTVPLAGFRDLVVALADHHLAAESRQRFIHEALGDA